MLLDSVAIDLVSGCDCRENYLAIYKSDQPPILFHDQLEGYDAHHA